MKNILIKLIPKKILVHLREIKKRKLLSDFYRYDRERYISSAFSYNNLSFSNLRSKITINYHSIEKGLSNRNVRFNFGQKAFDNLFSSMDEYIKLGYPKEDSRFQQAISVIDAYIKYHNENDEEFAGRIMERFQEYKKFVEPKMAEVGGHIEVNRDKSCDMREANFECLARNRHSIRDFGIDKVIEDDVKNAIKIAMNTPSSCNTQSWRTHIINNENLIKDILEIQGGMNGFGTNIQSLIIVTGDNEYMNGPNDRNQTFIDGGLFTMTLIYSLTALNIATCPLNTSFTITQEEKIRSLLNTKKSENFICIIALGSYPEVIRFTKSPRDTAEDIITYYN